MAAQRIIPPDVKAVRGIIFDLDGTLVDSYLPIMESLNHVRLSFGLTPYSLERVKKMVGRGLETLISRAAGEENVGEGVRLFREMYAKIFLEKTKLMPGVKEIIPSLALKGYLMAITSNKPSFFTGEILKAHGIHQFFRIVLGPDNASKPKPDPEMIETALQYLSLAKEQVIYIGDMTIDIETCRRAGVRIFAVTGGSCTREELEQGSPDMILDNLHEIDDLL